MEERLIAFRIYTTKDSLHTLGTCSSVKLAQIKPKWEVVLDPFGPGQEKSISSWGFLRLEGGNSPLILKEDFICKSSVSIHGLGTSSTSTALILHSRDVNTVWEMCL